MEKQKVSDIELYKTSFYIGLVGYGGVATLAQIKQTFVHEKKWITERDFLDAVSLSQIVPGAVGVNIMSYIGNRILRLRGGILAPFFYILPAFFAMILLSFVYFTYGNIGFFHSLFAGLGALVVALLFNATIVLGRSVFQQITWSDSKGILLALLAFAGIVFFHINTIWTVLLSGLAGFLFYRFTAEFEDETFSEKNESVLLHEKWLQTKDVPTLFTVLALIIGVCSFPLFRELFATFFKIGTFAFGGGFTAVPLIQHEVVNTLHWLSAEQFRDGIALGQITPGPVFITATFIGYKVAGFLGGVASTFGIFVSSVSLTLLLSQAHGKIKQWHSVRSVVKGFMSGFIGLLSAVTLQFALSSLVNWQTYFIFLASLVIIFYFKKDTLWAIAGTVFFSPLLL